MVRDGVNEPNATSLLAEFDGDLFLQRRTRRFGFDGSGKGSAARMRRDIDGAVIGEIGALDFRPGPQAMASIKTEFIASAESSLTGAFVKLILPIAEAISDDTRTNIRQHYKLDRIIGKKIGIRPAAVAPFFNSNHASSFANF